MPSRGRHFSATGLDRWIEVLDNFDKASEADEVRWRQATDVFFARTQQYTHIISGALLGSGRMDTYRDRRTITGEVGYGGTADCDYAVYEFARGGSHDALGRGFEATTDLFERTLAEIMEDRWRS